VTKKKRKMAGDKPAVKRALKRLAKIVEAKHYKIVDLAAMAEVRPATFGSWVRGAASPKSNEHCEAVLSLDVRLGHLHAPKKRTAEEEPSRGEDPVHLRLHDAGGGAGTACGEESVEHAARTLQGVTCAGCLREAGAEKDGDRLRRALKHASSCRENGCLTCALIRELSR